MLLLRLLVATSPTGETRIKGSCCYPACQVQGCPLQQAHLPCCQFELQYMYIYIYYIVIWVDLRGPWIGPALHFWNLVKCQVSSGIAIRRKSTEQLSADIRRSGHRWKQIAPPVSWVVEDLIPPTQSLKTSTIATSKALLNIVEPLYKCLNLRRATKLLWTRHKRKANAYKLYTSNYKRQGLSSRLNCCDALLRTWPPYRCPMVSLGQ